ncbi:head GIN domain-containing protein [Salinibacterium sp.]|uniref:head GIN domain-containing protein n=1 Tax=Salinibacterium sp. TaxID=1915057 RepID=UPI00286C2A26|nr:head GIN domain-containing protein [Salinibacterium sp.]
MRRTLALITVPACALLFLSGCGLASRGPVISEDRSIDTATSVVLDSWGDVTISEGEPSLVIHAPAEIMDRLTSDVKNSELVLGVRSGIPTVSGARIRYELTLPSLDGIRVEGAGDIRSNVPGDDLRVDINGAGDVDIDSVDAATVTVNVSGAGDATLNGRADELTVSLDGVGAVRAEKLRTARAIVDIAGSGDAAVFASDQLDASISGVGSVTYGGNPKVTQQISGVGEISRRQ